MIWAWGACSFTALMKHSAISSVTTSILPARSGPSSRKELCQRRAASSLRGPGDWTRDVVENHRDVAVPLAVRELVDPDERQAVESGGIESLADDPLDDLAHGHPGDPHGLGDRGLVGHASQVRRALLERRAEPATARTPGNLFVDDAAAGAFHPARSVAQPDPRRAEAEVAPLASLPLIVARRPLPAAAAARFLAPRPYLEHDSLGADFSRVHHDARDSQKRFEYLCHAHGIPNPLRILGELENLSPKAASNAPVATSAIIAVTWRLFQV